MKAIARWRRTLFVIGWCLFVAAVIALPIAGMRSPRLRLSHAYFELALWMWSGPLVSLLSLICILFGAGWKRWALGASALIELFLWFSFDLLVVQLS